MQYNTKGQTLLTEAIFHAPMMSAGPLIQVSTQGGRKPVSLVTYQGPEFLPGSLHFPVNVATPFQLFPTELFKKWFLN